MLRNYLKTALRTLWKNKKLATINIFGLALGIACSLLILLYVTDELSYDKYHRDANRIYRVVKDFINDDGSRIPDATTPGPLAAAMQREIPGVETITRIYPPWGNTTRMQYGDKKISEPRVYTVDSSFFAVFSIPFLKGDPATALNDVNSIVITASTAKRYFADEDPIGKTFRMNANDDVTVTGVVADVPPQSHFHYDFLLSFRRLPASVDTQWGSYNYYTYVKVRPGTDIHAFEKKIQNVYERNQEERFSDFYVQPLTDIHLASRLKWELEPNGDRLYVYIFMTVGLFILLIASINYINLSTAKSSVRAKETGIRKVSGAVRTSLVFQFLLESLIVAAISGGIALVVAYLVVPVVNDLTQKQLEIFGNPFVLLYVVAVTALVGIVAGLFPAMYLSSFQPVAVLKGLKGSERGALNLRRFLVVVQFTISIALIISTLVVMQQMNFLRSADLGFDKDQIIVLRNSSRLSPSERSSFLNTLKQIPGVQKASASGTILGQGFSTTRLRAKGSEAEQQLNFSSVDYNYLDVVGIEIKEGRGFSPEFPSDTMNNGILGGPLDQRLGAIVINERAVKEFGLGSDPLGKQLVWSADGDTTYYVEVVGVAKDFHFTSLRNEIKPYGFLMYPRNLWNFTVKLSGGNLSGTIASIEKEWTKLFPEGEFDYVFLDENFQRMYAAEGRFQKVFMSLVALGIVISCLGLFALATFTAEQRTKEIGIRKVLGASVAHIAALLSIDFLKLVLVAIVIAIPLAAYAMQSWLDGFAYRVAMQWWLFGGGAIISIVIALLTISAQAIRAAVANPVRSLRNE